VSTGRIYTMAELTAIQGGECDAVVPPIRVSEELREVVAGHAEARGETLSAFARRAMVRTLHADQVSAEAVRIRAAAQGDLFAVETGVGATHASPVVDQPQTEA